jgi:hypothetical protein
VFWVSRENPAGLYGEEKEKELIMNLDASYGFHRQRAALAERSRKLTGQATRLAAVVLLAATAYAQYGGTMGGTGGGTTSSGTYAPGTPGYGNGKAIGIGVGAAAVGAGAIYFMTHRASTITGCTEMADDGLRLTDDKSKRTLTILPGPADVKPGERVELKGKIEKRPAGHQNFVVKKVAKDFGECRPQASTDSPSSVVSEGR